MTIPTVTYVAGADLPDLALTLRDSTDAVIDFSSGWTFTLKVAPSGSTSATLTKTTGITGAASAPNVTIAWSTSGELNSLTPGRYRAQLTATRGDDSKHRLFEFDLVVKAAIT